MLHASQIKLGAPIRASSESCCQTPKSLFQPEDLALRIHGADQLKQYYRRLRWLLYRKPYAYKSTFPITKVDPTAINSFFGYYDKSPLSPSEDFIVYHTAASSTKEKPRPSAPVHIVARNRRSGEVIADLESAAYNWQQGTRVQWISDGQFIYNCYSAREDQYISHVYSIPDRKIVRTLPRPIYDCYRDEFALTLNFQRLSHYSPDYGYFCRAKDTKCNSLNDDGIWRVDIRSGNSKLILSLAQIVALWPSPEMDGARHTVNLVMLSPGGAWFAVIHRWYRHGSHHDRLLIARSDGAEVKLLSDEGMVSHYFWLSNSCLLAYLRHQRKDGYYKLNVTNAQFAPLPNGLAAGFSDGHPHVMGASVVIDTYPDRARMQRLYLLHMHQSELKLLGEFFEPFGFQGETRCDLHPRFDRIGSRIFFDSTYDGTRQLYEMELD